MYFLLEKLGISSFPQVVLEKKGGYRFTPIEQLESVLDFPQTGEFHIGCTMACTRWITRWPLISEIVLAVLARIFCGCWQKMVFHLQA